MQAISSRSIPCHLPGALVLAGLFVVVGLAIPEYTQTVASKKSSTDKKETTVTQLATAQVDSDPSCLQIAAMNQLACRSQVRFTEFPPSETLDVRSGNPSGE